MLRFKRHFCGGFFVSIDNAKNINSQIAFILFLCFQLPLLKIFLVNLPSTSCFIFTSTSPNRDEEQAKQNKIEDKQTQNHFFKCNIHIAKILFSKFNQNLNQGCYPILNKFKFFKQINMIYISLTLYLGKSLHLIGYT